MKKMLEGELFLEEIYGNPEDVNKVTGINLWACAADGKPPMNILEESTKAFLNHELAFNTKRTFDRDLSNDEYNINKQIQKDPWDPAIHPHGATSTPAKNRIASYDDNGRLRSVDPALGNNPRSEELTQVVTLGRITDDYKALTIKIDALRNEMLDKFANLVNDAPLALDQLNELSQALNNDPDFYNTIKGILDTKATKIELDNAMLELTTCVDNTNEYITAHRTAPLLDHPDGSVIAAKLANNAVTTDKIDALAVTAAKLANTLDLTGKTITVKTPALP
jgi:hypothetical protein